MFNPYKFIKWEYMRNPSIVNKAVKNGYNKKEEQFNSKWFQKPIIKYDLSILYSNFILPYEYIIIYTNKINDSRI